MNAIQGAQCGDSCRKILRYRPSRSRIVSRSGASPKDYFLLLIEVSRVILAAQSYNNKGENFRNEREFNLMTVPGSALFVNFTKSTADGLYRF